METKKIRLTAFFLVLLPLCVAMVETGCEKKEKIYDPESVVGKWQIIQYPEYCVGFGNKIIEFTPDSVFKLYLDGKLNFLSTFNLKTGSMDYDTIFYDDHVGYYSWELITLKGKDTLHLIPPILTALPICDHYKRKK